MTLPLARATLDRAAHIRADDDALERCWRDPRARVVRVHEMRAAVTGDPPALSLHAPAEFADSGTRYFLGLDAGGTPFFAVSGPYDLAAGEFAAGLRRVGAILPDRDLGMLVHAIALDNWHVTHTHCPRCGASTRIVAGGHARRCDADGSQHFPRTDPAVIMLVVDDDGRALLGHQPVWPEGRFSTLAGFVEPGETLEQAVAREVYEEVGVRVDGISYTASQPWPFPSSLMLGFQARATGVDLRVDGEEITEARWFTRSELLSAAQSREVLLPSAVSIARRLIEDWYGGPLPADNHW
jgi:NAD+ diphosphatase